ncbi:MarR family transcriptional regulator [Chitiniphilus purpureus]|uniref:MarR family transcriptional regulator n=1 Tax=Chitiniphilus purpureus TaxID=2981137 RepID=A0ABY6DW09_9NEIS|nr:MarR family transcriptional regulator [Chitiniphilus sp. CD1]UXY16033.1 MarR family transcriptional regulator [Chitiniphilus sp. CD1]
MNQDAHTPDCFRSVEHKIGLACDRLPGCSRQHALLSQLLRHVQGRLHDRMHEVLREHGLNPVSFSALTMLYSAPDSVLNPSDLAQATSESRANVTRICDELVARGLLLRAHNDEDRRRIDLRLACDGAHLVESLLPVLQARVHSVYDVLQPHEKDQLETLLKRVLGALA